MKKYLILLFVLCSIRAFTQSKTFDEDHENFFRAGAKAGVNINKISGKSYQQGFSYNFQVGAFMQFNFSKKFGIQPEISFVQSSSDFTDDAGDIYNDLFLDGSQKKAKLNYLEVPVLLNVNLGPSKHVKLQFGPSLPVGSPDELVRRLKIFDLHVFCIPLKCYTPARISESVTLRILFTIIEAQQREIAH